jgi:hypothetical protein
MFAISVLAMTSNSSVSNAGVDALTLRQPLLTLIVAFKSGPGSRLRAPFGAPPISPVHPLTQASTMAKVTNFR